MLSSPSIWRFVLFGGLGMLGEICFTATQTLIQSRSWQLQGVTYLWMFPIYGLISIFFPTLYWTIDAYPWLIRGIIYMLFIFAVEYLTGTLLTRLTGKHIWHYTDRFNIKGQITLYYIPVWFIVGLLIEHFFPKVHHLSQILAKGF